MRTNDEIKGHRDALVALLDQTDTHLHIAKLTVTERQEGEFLIRQLEGEIELCSWMLGDIPFTWLTVDDGPSAFDFGVN